MKILAIFIKTFLRDEALYNTVNAIKENVHDIDYRIYIADDGEISEKKQQYYSELESQGHIVLRLPFNIGASSARNLLIEQLKDEKYVLRMDDDFEITKETSLKDMIKLMENIPKIGAVADLERQVGDGKGVFDGEINKWQGFIEKKSNKIVKTMVPLEKFKYQKFDDIKYAKADFTRNMIMLRRDLFKSVKWEDRLRFAGEHLDFLMQIKNSSYDLVFITNSIHSHREDILQSKEERGIYLKLKNDNPEKGTVFEEKWGVKKVVIKRPLIYLVRSIIVKIILGLRGR